jgi:hypothetical protein
VVGEAGEVVANMVEVSSNFMAKQGRKLKASEFKKSSSAPTTKHSHKYL